MQAKQVLLIDIGNSRIKYRRLDQASEDVTSTDDIHHLISVLKNSDTQVAYVSNVRNPEVLDELRNIAQQYSLTLVEVTTESSAFGLLNSYQDVSKMGVDRWLAMLGAMGLTAKPFAVINAGTAVTVDFVAEGKHLGGWIAPGFNTMKSALVNATEFVTKDDQAVQGLHLGTSTEACVTHGCYAALTGIAGMAEFYLQQHFAEYLIIHTGGDRNLLTNTKSSVNLCAANLVIDGLARYAEKVLFD